MNLNELFPALGKTVPTTTNEKGGRQSYLPFRADLLDGVAMLRLSNVLKTGADKYGPDNWRNIDVHEHLNHAMCHILGYLAERQTGTEHSDDHLDHAFCRLMMAVAMAARQGAPSDRQEELPDRQRIYLAGPMTGRPGCNHETFNRVAGILRRSGKYVENPAETDGGSIDRPRSFYMRKALAKMLACDTLVLLPGWTGSRGAVLETALAMELGMEILIVDGPITEDGVSLRPLLRDAPDYGFTLEISHGNPTPEEDTLNDRIKVAFISVPYRQAEG